MARQPTNRHHHHHHHKKQITTTTTATPAADFLATADTCLGDLLATLTDRGLKPGPRHARALHSLLAALSFNFHGKTHARLEAVLSSLSPGQGKTTALQTFINHVSKHPEALTESGRKFSEVGILVCINTLDEIKAFCEGLDRSNLCIWIGAGDTDDEKDKAAAIMELGAIADPREAQVLVTTHRRIEIELQGHLADTDGTMWDTCTLSYAHGSRLVRVWDEAYLGGQPVVLPLRDLKRTQPHLAEVAPDAAESLAHALRVTEDLLSFDKQVTTLAFPSIWEGADLEDIIRDLAADRSISAGHLEFLSDTLRALDYITGKQVVIRGDGNSRGNVLLTYTPTIPDSFLPVVILDASGAKGIRRTYDQMVETKRLSRLEPHVTKSYKHFSIDVWKKGGGKSSFIDSFAHRVEGIANWIVSEVPRGESILVIHHRPDTPEQIEAKERRRKRKQYHRPIMQDFKAALLDHIAQRYPDFDISNLAFTTWGKHRARNDWKDFPNVVAAGTLFKPDSVYEATYRIARRLSPGSGSVGEDTLGDFKLGEYADDLLQGLGRIRIRQSHAGNWEVAPPARALVVAHVKSNIPKHLKDWFTGARVRDVVLMPENDLPENAATVLAYLEDWRKRSPKGASVTFRDVKKTLKIDNETFRDQVMRNVELSARLQQIGLVPYKKDPKASAYFQGWQLTSDIEHTQKQLADEREAVRFGFIAA